MRTNRSLTRLLLVACLGLPVLCGAEEMDGDASHKFLNEQRLIDTLMRDDDESQPGFGDELERTTQRVGELEPEQLFALNRALNNSLASNLIVEMGSAELERVIEGDYNPQQINALTQGFEQEARFRMHAERFEALADTTGDEKFLERAERFQEKAEHEKAKFLAKIDHFSDAEAPDEQVSEPNSSDAAERRVGRESRERAAVAARASAREEAKRSAHDRVRSAERGAWNDGSKETARRAARDLVRKEDRKAARRGPKGRRAK